MKCISRLEQIKQYIASLPPGSKPSYASIGRYLGLTSKSSLRSWFVRNKIDPELVGLSIDEKVPLQEWEVKIRRAVDEIKKQNKRPTLKRVSKFLNCNIHSLKSNIQRIGNKCGIKRCKYKVGRRRKLWVNTFRNVAISLKTQGIEPNSNNIADALNMKRLNLYQLLKYYKISFEEVGFSRYRSEDTYHFISEKVLFARYYEYYSKLDYFVPNQVIKIPKKYYLTLAQLKLTKEPSISEDRKSSRDFVGPKYISPVDEVVSNEITHILLDCLPIEIRDTGSKIYDYVKTCDEIPTQEMLANELGVDTEIIKGIFTAWRNVDNIELLLRK